MRGKGATLLSGVFPFEACVSTRSCQLFSLSGLFRPRPITDQDAGLMRCEPAARAGAGYLSWSVLRGLCGVLDSLDSLDSVGL